MKFPLYMRLLLLVVVALGAVYVGSQAIKEGNTEPTDTYLTYLNAHRASVHLVDSDDLTSPARVSNKPVLDAYRLLMALNSYDPETKTYSDLHIHSVFWIEEADGDTANLNGGPVVGLPVDKSSGGSTSERISRVNDACYVFWFADDPVNKKKFMVVRTAGEDKRCYTSDDGKVLVHSGMTGTNAPVEMKGEEIIASIYGGGITGFLIFKEGNVLRCKTNLRSCGQPLLRGAKKVKKLAIDPVRGNVYVCADGELYIFDGADLNRVGAPCRSIRDAWYDGTAVYAVSSGNLLKLYHGRGSWETIYDGGDAKFIEGLTRDYVVISTAEGLKAVKKDGSSQFSLGNRYVYGWATANAFVYTRSDSSGIKYACFWREGSSNPVCTRNAYWAGFSLARSGTIDISGGFAFQIYKLLKVEEVSYDSKGRAVGGILYAVDPADTSNKIRLGQVPSGLRILGFGIGDRLLLRGFDGKQSDVFYADIGKPGGLRRITYTADGDEFPFFYPSGSPSFRNMRSLVSIFH